MEGTVTISLWCYNRLKVTRKELEDEYLAEHQQEEINRLTYWNGLVQGNIEGEETIKRKYGSMSMLQRLSFLLWGV